MTCKDCIHYGMCENWIKEVKNEFNVNASLLSKDCSYFKDKSKIIELPIKCTPELKSRIEKEVYEMCVDEL